MLADGQHSGESMINKPMIAVAAAVVLIAAGTWYFLHSRQTAKPVAAAPAQPAPPDTASEPPIEHPLPADTADTAAKTPLPALNDSDAVFRRGAQPGGRRRRREGLSPAAESHSPPGIVTIDNLPRQKVAVDKRPSGIVDGAFAAEGDELHATLDPRNFARYEPMVAVIRQLDMRKLAAVYVRFYPLFQQSYQDLGYPNGYFNDRLVKVIDVLLAAPQPADRWSWSGRMSCTPMPIRRSRRCRRDRNC